MIQGLLIALVVALIFGLFRVHACLRELENFRDAQRINNEIFCDRINLLTERIDRNPEIRPIKIQNKGFTEPEDFID